MVTPGLTTATASGSTGFVGDPQIRGASVKNDSEILDRCPNSDGAVILSVPGIGKV